MSRPAAIDDGDVPELSPWRQLVLLIGEAAALQLEEALGGRRVFVPRKLGDHHPIAAAIGLQLALSIAGAFGGEHLDIPLSAGRRARIVKLKASGLSVEQVRSRVGCSRRLVFLALAEAKAGAGTGPETPQLKLI
jgi:hypothetical protein